MAIEEFGETRGEYLPGIVSLMDLLDVEFEAYCSREGDDDLPPSNESGLDISNPPGSG